MAENINDETEKDFEDELDQTETEVEDTDTTTETAEDEPGDTTEASADDEATEEEEPLSSKVSRLGNLLYRYNKHQSEAHGRFGDPMRGQGRVLTLLKAKPETT